jgi:hypothetical protein
VLLIILWVRRNVFAASTDLRKGSFVALEQCEDCLGIAPRLTAMGRIRRLSGIPMTFKPNSVADLGKVGMDVISVILILLASQTTMLPEQRKPRFKQFRSKLSVCMCILHMVAFFSNQDVILQSNRNAL